jgi:LysM repeat protein
VAVNAYLEIGGNPSPSTSKGGAIDILGFGTQTPTQPATVQVGEQTMGQVAGRLGLNPDQLLAANPHIKDPNDLKAGQEINLPGNPALQNQAGGAEQPNAGAHHHPHHHRSEELPNAPLGSSIEASMTKAKLDGLAAKEGDD